MTLPEVGLNYIYAQERV